MVLKSGESSKRRKCEAEIVNAICGFHQRNKSAFAFPLHLLQLVSCHITKHQTSQCESREVPNSTRRLAVKFFDPGNAISPSESTKTNAYKFFPSDQAISIQIKLLNHGVQFLLLQSLI